MDAKIELGKKIKQIREEKKLTQAELAEKTGMHVNYISKIERGVINTSIEKLHLIAKALKTNLQIPS
jgi:transcriptional regulator with XRE-family HTH domain